MGSLRRLGRRVGVFWDVDGTLSDSSSLGLQATNAVLAGHALQSVTLAQYHAGTKFPTAERFSWHLTGAFSDPMGARLGRQFDDLHLDMVNEQTTGFYPGITEMLLEVVEEARGEVVYAALSNGCGEYVRRVLACSGLAHLFPLQLGADEVPRAKPRPEGLELLASRLAIPAHHCLYIGDSPTDGAAARAAGMGAVGVAWGAHGGAELAPAFPTVVDTPGQLKEAILGHIDNMHREKS